jgi:predicted nucleic acid-binding protein
VESKKIVLDANIIIRGVFGVRVRSLLIDNQDFVDFFTPELCLKEAKKYIPAILEKKGISLEDGLAVFELVRNLLTVVDEERYCVYEKTARERIQIRDPDDWPVVATALLLNCPIWTEDTDFFGSGIATWTTDRVEFYLRIEQEDYQL